MYKKKNKNFLLNEYGEKKNAVGHKYYRLKSGLDVYGAETSLIFNTIMAVINIHIIFTMVSDAETMPQMQNSVGI